MSSLCRKLCLSALLLWCGEAFAQMPLRVCADPDNLPFSNSSQSGFDNRIAQLLGSDLHRPVVFVWARSLRGFMRERFNKGACDMLMGVPQGMDRVLTTVPYYRSSYVFVTRRSDHLHLTRFDDPAIGQQRIGLQMLQEDFSPPSVPLTRSGHAAQFVGFRPFGEDGGEIIRAVAAGRVGFSIVWGPLAGYYAAQQSVPLALTPVKPEVDSSGIPFSFSIAIGVHKNDTALAGALNDSLRRNRGRIHAILASYHVPLTTEEGGNR